MNDQVPSTGDTALHTVLGSSLGKMTIKFVRLLLDNGGDVDRYKLYHKLLFYIIQFCSG